MPPETATAAPDVKTTTGNIVKGVQTRASGKVPAAPKGPDKPVADGDEKAPVAAVPDPNAGKRKFVVEGQERWLTPEQADAYVQKGIAFEPKISEIARMRQEMAQFEQALLNNPGQIFAGIAKKTGKPIGQLVQSILSSTASDEVKEATGQWYWENVGKRQQMDPKDLALLERDEKIKILEASDKSRADMVIAQENQNRVSAALATVKAQISESLTTLGIKNPDSAAGIRMAKEIADVMRVSYLSRQPCTAQQAADKVRARIQEYQREFYDVLDDDKLVESLGKENAEKVRKYFLKLVKEQEKTEQKPGAAPPTKRGERETITPDQMRDYLTDLKRNSK